MGYYSFLCCIVAKVKYAKLEFTGISVPQLLAVGNTKGLHWHASPSTRGVDKQPKGMWGGQTSGGGSAKHTDSAGVSNIKGETSIFSGGNKYH